MNLHKNKKLFQLLDSMIETEGDLLRSFSKHLKSSNLDQGDKLSHLFDYVKKHPWVSEEDTLELPKKLEKQLFDGKIEDEKLLQRLSYQLSNEMEKFLEQDALNKRDYLQRKLRAEAMRELHLNEQFEKTSRAILAKYLPDKEAEKQRLAAEIYEGLYFFPGSDTHEEKEYEKRLFKAITHHRAYDALKKMKFYGNYLAPRKKTSLLYQRQELKS